MDLLTTDTRSDRVEVLGPAVAAEPESTRRDSAPPRTSSPDPDVLDPGPDPWRMALARGIVRLFSSTIPASSGLRIEFQDGRAGVPVMGDPPERHCGSSGPEREPVG